MRYDKGVYRSLTQILQFGINMLVPIILCTFLGIFLDRILGTSFIVIILFFLGALAGGRNVYIFARHIYEKPPVHDEVKVRGSNYDESKRPGGNNMETILTDSFDASKPAGSPDEKTDRGQ